MDNSKTLIYSALALSGAAAILYLLSRDSSNEVRFNPKVHTLEKLKKLLEDMQLDFTCIYVRAYNLILTMKENNQFKPQMLADFSTQINHEIGDKAAQIIKSHNTQLFISQVRAIGLSRDRQKELISKFQQAGANETALIAVFAELDAKNARKLYDEWKAKTLNQGLYEEWIAYYAADP